MDRLWQDLRYASRSLRKSPGFLLVAVLSLGLGIGANTAIFSLINAVMLCTLPVAHPEQLVLLIDPSAAGVSVETTQHGERTILSYPEFEQLRAHNTVFSSLLAAQSEVSDLDVYIKRSGQEQSTKAHTQLVSGEFFGVLGVKPAAGRFFTPEEDQTPGANPVTVISYGFWQSEFASSDVVGKTVRIGQSQFQIVGVAPAGFRGILVGSITDMWLPITMQEQVLPGRNYLKPRDTLWLQVMGRLKPGTSRATAQAGVNVEFQQILRQWAAAAPTEGERRGMLEENIVVRDGARGASELRGEFSDPLVLLMAMVGLVLLIACANIANVMLARASGRQREIGVRLALGAGRVRVMGQLLTESMLVAALGAVLGTFLAVWGDGLLLRLVSSGVDDLALQVPHDYRVFGFTAAISLFTGILFGLAPAFRATRVDVNRTLTANARGSIGGRGRVRTGRLLVVAQVALSLVLLMGAALFVRSLHNMVAQKLGFNRDHLLMVRIDPVSAGYKGAGVMALYQRVIEKVRAVPGVRGVTLSNAGMFSGDSGDHLTIEGSPVTNPKERASYWTLVGPDYFRTTGIPLLRGREIDATDAAQGSHVCVINQSFARKFYPNSDAIGKHIRDEYPTTRETYEIVGIVADSKQHELTTPVEPRFYATLFHPIGTVDSVALLINTTGEPGSIVPSVRRALAEVDRSLPVLSTRTVNDQIDRRLVTQRRLRNSPRSSVVWPF
jgi:predicted permease